MTPNTSPSRLRPESPSFSGSRYGHLPRRAVLRLSGLAVAARSLSSRAASLFLAVTLLSTSAPAAPRVLADAASEWRATASVWRRTSPLVATLTGLLAGQGSPRAMAQEKQLERDARVRRVVISPGNVTALAGEAVRFAAVAYDGDGGPLGGVNFAWGAQEEKRGGGAFISPHGEFTSTVAGKFVVTVEAGGHTAHTTVTVLEAAPPAANAAAEVRYISSRDLPPTLRPKSGRGKRPRSAGKPEVMKT